VVQAVLTDEDVFWLDCFTDLYVWYGANSRGSLRLLAMRHAKEYAAFAASIRDASVEVSEVHSGAEPSEFTWQFHAWRVRPPRKDPRAEKIKALVQEALEDRQLEQMDANLAREERWELREGEFDDRPLLSTPAPFDVDSFIELTAVAGAPEGVFSCELVLGPGVHRYQWEIDAGDWVHDARRPTEEIEGVGTVNKLRVLGRDANARPTQYTLIYKPPQPPAEGEAPPAPLSIRVRGFPQSALLANWQAEHGGAS
jgi:hypothetical protein